MISLIILVIVTIPLNFYFGGKTLFNSKGMRAYNSNNRNNTIFFTILACLPIINIVTLLRSLILLLTGKLYF